MYLYIFFWPVFMVGINNLNGQKFFNTPDSNISFTYGVLYLISFFTTKTFSNETLTPSAIIGHMYGTGK